MENSYILLHINFVHHNIYHVFIVINIMISILKKYLKLLKIRKLEEVLKLWIQSSNFENHFPEDRKKKLSATI